MPPIISVRQLGKKYTLGHRSPERYSTLRDVMVNGAKRITHKLRHPFSVSEADSIATDFWALRDISFDIHQGDRVALIGRNGAGKSTLLKILSRITEPTTGQVKIKGRVASLLEVGTGFHPELTGRENIFLNGAILGMSKAEIKKKFDEIVAFAEVEKFLDTPVKRYSSGMYVRLAFAVAAHLEPEVLIVDEVLAVGDAQFQKKCLGKMEEVGKEGRTVLFVSHNMAAIQALCTTAIRIGDGTILGQGDVATQVGIYLKEGQKKNIIHPDSNVMCGPDIHLVRFEFSPDLVTSKADTKFILELSANHATDIKALAILIYSEMGERVAIIDLRNEDGYCLINSQSLIIEGMIHSVPLVEGNYSVGLYLEYGGFRGNVLGILDLMVVRSEKILSYAPYHASVRGIVELDYSIAQLRIVE